MITHDCKHVHERADVGFKVSSRVNRTGELCGLCLAQSLVALSMQLALPPAHHDPAEAKAYITHIARLHEEIAETRLANTGKLKGLQLTLNEVGQVVGRKTQIIQLPSSTDWKKWL